MIIKINIIISNNNPYITLSDLEPYNKDIRIIDLELIYAFKTH